MFQGRPGKVSAGRLPTDHLRVGSDILLDLDDRHDTEEADRRRLRLPAEDAVAAGEVGHAAPAARRLAAPEAAARRLAAPEAAARRLAAPEAAARRRAAPETA